MFRGESNFYKLDFKKYKKIRKKVYYYKKLPTPPSSSYPTTYLIDMILVYRLT